MEIPSDPVVLSGYLSVLFLTLSAGLAAFRRTRKTFHRYFAHLAALAAVVHVMLVPVEAFVTSPAVIAGAAGLAALLFLMLTGFRTAPRRCRAATSAARARAAGSWHRRYPRTWRTVHRVLAVCAVAALTAHIVIIQDSTSYRWLFVVVGEGIAVALIWLYVLPHPFRKPRAPARHLRTTETRTEAHDTGILTRTAPLQLRPEKRHVPARRIGITQCAEVPVCLTYSPDVLYVASTNKCDLLTYRRELQLAGGRARYVRSLHEIRLPEGEEARLLSEYIVCGDPVFLTDVHEFLIHHGVPHSRIRSESTASSPVLPADHPSARITRIQEHVFR